MRKHLSFLLFLLLIFQSSCSLPVLFTVLGSGILFSKYFSLNVIGYLLYDLYAETEDDFTKLAALWKINENENPSQGKVYLCQDPYYLVGGYNLNSGDYLKRTYTSLPSHTRVSFHMFLYTIDDWDADQQLIVQFDGVTISSMRPADVNDAEKYLMCGNADQLDSSHYYIVGTTPHTSSELTITFSGGSGIYGVRQVRLVFLSTIPFSSVAPCILLDSELSRSAEGACPCGPSFYQDASLVCQPCSVAAYECIGPSDSDLIACWDGQTYDPTTNMCRLCNDVNCMLCSGTSSDQCDQCQANYYLDWNRDCQTSCSSPNIGEGEEFRLCLEPCPSSSDFVLWDSTCSSSCPSPFLQSTSNGSNFCTNPCGYPADEYLYWDGSCNSSCPYLNDTLNGVNLCKTPCTGSSGFMMPDGTCANSCDSPPFTVLEYGPGKLCITPCGYPSDEYLYWDGSCNLSCSYLTDTLNGVNLCQNPCANSESYMMPNGSCSSSCDSPFVGSDVGPGKLCITPCGYPSDEYLYSDGSCESSCPYTTATLYGVNLCEALCTGSEPYMMPDGSCSSSCGSPFTESDVGSSILCMSPCGYPSNDYLYWDGSCNSSCPYLTDALNGVNLCENPCTGSYMMPNGSCSSSCDSPLIESDVGPGKLCINPCGSLDEYLYPDGTCASTCNLPLIGSGGDSDKVCTTPCGSEYLYWEGSCNSSCPYLSATLNGVNLCKTPCTDSSGFMIWDDTCSGSCDWPLISSVSGPGKLCSSPCGYPSDEYLYWDGTCQSSCLYLTDTLNGIKVCKAPCQDSGAFMKWNGTCATSCDSPFISYTSGLVKFCDSPCPDNATFLYLDDSQCRSTCDYPYQVQETILCVSTLSSSDQESAKKMANALGTTDLTTSSVGTSLGFFNFRNPSSIFVSIFPEMAQNIKYMKVQFPPKLWYFYHGQKTKSFLSIPESLETRIENKTIPENFGQYGLHSSFLVNFWQQILILSIIFIATLTVSVLNYLLTGSSFLKSICSKIRQALKWNFTLSLFTSYFGKMILFTSLESKTFSFDTNLTVLSFLLCSIINICSVIAFLRMIFIIADQRKFLKQSTVRIQNFQTSKKTFADYDVLFKNFHGKSFLQQAFLPIFIARMYIFTTFIAYLIDSPVIQASFGVVLSSGMLLYLAISRPPKSKIDLAQYILQEIVLLIVNVSVLALSIYDAQNIADESTRVVFGEIILDCYVAFSVIGSLFVGIRIFITLSDGIKTYRNRRALSKYKAKSSSKISRTSTPEEQRGSISQQNPNLQLQQLDPVKMRNLNVNNIQQSSGLEIVDLSNNGARVRTRQEYVDSKKSLVQGRNKENEKEKHRIIRIPAESAAPLTSARKETGDKRIRQRKRNRFLNQLYEENVQREGK